MGSKTTAGITKDTTNKVKAIIKTTTKMIACLGNGGNMKTIELKDGTTALVINKDNDISIHIKSNSDGKLMQHEYILTTIWILLSEKDQDFIDYIFGRMKGFGGMDETEK